MSFLRSTGLLLGALLIAAPVAVRAQEMPEASPLSAAPVQGDGSAEAGRRDGRSAAGAPGVGGRFAAGFVGGLPVGFFGLFALSDQDLVQIGGTGAGLLVVGAAAAAGETAPPPPLAEAAAAHGPEYEQAFRRGYAERLRSRRRTAGLLGGVTGTAAGFGVLVWMLSQMT